MNPLSPNDFDAFFRELHGYAPFPWQRKLARLAAQEGYPSALAVPTAGGKTACLDIAVFALACQANRPPSDRTAPLRIFFVVDRRLIVDEAFERATMITQKLADAKGGVLKVVADRLKTLSGGKVPLACFRMRGGIHRDNSWTDSPVQPTIMTGTVDQVGSRMLFRGYGSSFRMRPIHAALMANDSLIILDEVQCSEPFRKTAASVARHRLRAEKPVYSPFCLMVMSATLPSNIPALRADHEDMADEELGRRISASKPIRLGISKNAKGKQALEWLAKDLAKHAAKMVDDDFRAVAIIANRVDTARMVYDILRNTGNSDAVLLTGRMRPYDRDRVVEEWCPFLTAGTDRPPLERPLFVVATQCLEVGVNLDFDAMVSECAPLDSLRQRFGRLNRLGRATRSAGMVVVRADQENQDGKNDDRIYGTALSATWQWLSKQAKDGVIDMGYAALDEMLEYEDSEQLLAPQSDAPVMLPAHIDALVQTRPSPSCEPDIDTFLHGIGRRMAEVEVVVRTDLPTNKIAAEEKEQQKDVWIKTLRLCPPIPAERFRVPLYVFHEWLAGESVSDMADIMGEWTDPPVTDRKQRPGRVMIWRGKDSKFVGKHSRIKAGDVIIVPSIMDWRAFGYVPEGAKADIADELYPTPNASLILRLHADLVDVWPNCPAKEKLEKLNGVNLDDALNDLPGLIEALKAVADEDGCPAWFASKRPELDNIRAEDIHEHPSGGIIVRRVKKRYDILDDEDDSIRAASPVELQKHSAGVCETARRFIRACGLQRELEDDIMLAASLHDIGKIDPRFQAWLHGGDAALVSGPPLAKSRVPIDHTQMEMMRRRSGWPKGGRHELLSMRMAEPMIKDLAHDPDLVRHLVASHHGHCRPLAPVVRDDNPPATKFEYEGRVLETHGAVGLESLDSGITDRFWGLVERYGWWGMAWLETILRLADHHCSGMEE